MARDLLNQMLHIDANTRITIDDIKDHRFFTHEWQTPEKTAEIYWQKVKSKTLADPPYKPNPLKYRYLLQNSYDLKSNLEASSPSIETRKLQKSNSKSNVEKPKDREDSPEAEVKISNSPAKLGTLFGDYTITRVNREF